MGQGGGPSKFMFSCGVRVTGGSPCPDCGAGPEAPDEACTACMTRKRLHAARAEHVQSQPAPEDWPGWCEWRSPCARCGVPTDTTGESVAVLDQCIRFAPSLAWEHAKTCGNERGASVAVGRWRIACFEQPRIWLDRSGYSAGFGDDVSGAVATGGGGTVPAVLAGLAAYILGCTIEDSAELLAAAEVLAEAGRRHADGGR